METELSTAKQNGKDHRDMVEGYQKHLSTGRKEAGPREAHMFALAMAHKGVNYGRSVSDVVIALAGELPSYWPKG